jgi:hypothetical protein
MGSALTSSVSFVALVITCISSGAWAECARAKQQEAIAGLGMQVKIRFDRDHIPLSIEGRVGLRTSDDPVESALSALRTIAPVYCASAADDFMFGGGRPKPDELGQADVVINQTYRGVQVVGPSLRVHLTHDSVTMIRGSFTPGISVSIKPALTGLEASRIALQHIVELGGINIAVTELRVPVVFVNFVNKDGAYFAYPVRVDYTIDNNDRYLGGHHLDDIFIDANDGAVVGVRALIIRDP